ncbi:MAG TPA: hypothetical protein PKW42_08120, partial [bacterium]|nr:hypothetical protein [bacterium]
HQFLIKVDKKKERGDLLFRLLQSLSLVLLKNLLVWSLPCFRLVKQTNGYPARMNFSPAFYFL